MKTATSMQGYLIGRPMPIAAYAGLVGRDERWCPQCRRRDRRISYLPNAAKTFSIYLGHCIWR